jgi:hypothetical protein
MPSRRRVVQSYPERYAIPQVERSWNRTRMPTRVPTTTSGSRLTSTVRALLARRPRM